MFKTKIEGTAEFSDEQFSFSGGYAPDTHVIPHEMKLRGTLNITPNAEVSFRKDASTIAAPPLMKTILKTETFTLKRSNRNYILHSKYPIVQPNETTQTLIQSDHEKIMAAIEADRKEVQEIMN